MLLFARTIANIYPGCYNDAEDSSDGRAYRSSGDGRPRYISLDCALDGRVPACGFMTFTYEAWMAAMHHGTSKLTWWVLESAAASRSETLSGVGS